MPKINKILLKWEGFQYEMSLDLNMGYNIFRLIEDASNLCTTILPWVKYHNKRLAMRLSNPPEILQQKMNNIFQVFLFIHAYADELLIFTKMDWKNNTHKLELTVNKLNENGLEFNIEYSFFGQTKITYLGL